MKPASTYDGIAQALHWLVAGAIVLQFVLANVAEAAEEQARQLEALAVFAAHKSVGITILGFAILRLAWRWRHPVTPVATAPWQHHAARISHVLLYTLLFLLPITGWLMSSAAAYSVSWFNVIALPDLIQPNERAEAVLTTIHEGAAKLLAAVAFVHLLAALKHHFVDRDNVLRRMTSWWGLPVFLAVIAVGVWQLVNNATSAAPAEQTSTEAAAEEKSEAKPAPSPEASRSELPPWPVDYENSAILFFGEQAGANFSGIFEGWRADVRFEPTRLSESDARVTVDVRTARTEDDTRDATLQETEWFHSAEFPEAVFSTHRFSEPTPGEYIAHGTLAIKAVTVPVDLYFTLREGDGYRWLEGEALLDRFALTVGTGQWLDDEWVGQEIRVTVRLQASLRSDD